MPTARSSTRIQPKSQQAVSESTAFLMSSMLADVVNAGTAYKARQAGFTLPAAGKTGTTNDYVDAWFVGYTPHLMTGVWVGFDQPQTIVANGYAGDLAVPIWAAFMKVATKGDKPDWFDRPSNVVGSTCAASPESCRMTGCDHVDVVNDDGTIETKSMVYTDYFVKGTQPTTLCPLHPGRSMFATMAGAFGIQVGKPAPVPADAAALPPAAAGTSGASPAQNGQSSTKVEEPKKKKRGFWSRLFGGGDDDKNSGDKKPDDKDKKNPKKPGGGQSRQDLL